jgi:hypothetical protein
MAAESRVVDRGEVQDLNLRYKRRAILFALGFTVSFDA